MKYIYTATFTPSDDGTKFFARVPDLPRCITTGNSLSDAIDQITDAASGWLVFAEDNGDIINPPSPQNTLDVPNGTIKSLIQIDTLQYRAQTDDRSVRENVSLPAWMATMADKRHIKTRRGNSRQFNCRDESVVYKKYEKIYVFFFQKIDIQTIVWYSMCMKNNLIHYRTSVCNINYHIVWCVKYRRKVLTPEIEAYLKEQAQEIAKSKGFTVHLLETGNMDHVHCFVSAPPMLCITDIVKYLKGITGRRLFEKYPELRNQLWNGQLWNHSYL